MHIEISCLLFVLFLSLILTNDHEFILGEAVLGNLEVQRSRALPYTTRNVVVRTVARAEPATEVTGFTDGHTTKVSADT